MKYLHTFLLLSFSFYFFVAPRSQGKALKMIESLLREAQSESDKKAKLAKEKFKKAAKAAAQKAKKVKKFVNKHKKHLGLAGTAATAVVSGLTATTASLGAVAIAGKYAAKKIAKNPVVQVIQHPAEAVKDASKQVVTKILQLFMVLKNALLEALKNAERRQQLKRYIVLQQKGDSRAEDENAEFNKLGEKLGNITDEERDWANNPETTASAFFDAAAKAALESFKTAINAIHTDTGALEVSAEILEKFNTAYKQLLNEAKRLYVENKAAIGMSFLAIITSIIKTLVQLVPIAANKFAPELVKLARDFLTAQLEKVTDNKAAKALYNTYTGIINLFQNTIPETYNSALEFGTKTYELFKKILDAKELLKKALNAAKNTAAAQQALEIYKNTIETIKEKAPQLYNSALEYGKNTYKESLVALEALKKAGVDYSMALGPLGEDYDEEGEPLPSFAEIWKNVLKYMPDMRGFTFLLP